MNDICTGNEAFELRMKKFGMRIKEERKRNGLTQAQMGRAVTKLNGDVVKQNTVCNWETGAARPGIRTLFAIAQVLGCDLGYLLGDYDEQTHDLNGIRSATGLSEETVAALCNLRAQGKEKKVVAAINAVVSDYRRKGNKGGKTIVDLVNLSVSIG